MIWTAHFWIPWESGDQVDIDFLKKRNLPMPDDYKQKIAAMGFPEAARYTIERFGFSGDTGDAC